MGELKNKRRSRIIVILLAVIVVLGLMFVGFKALVRVGNPKYFYNYLHDAAGSLPTEYHAGAAENADADTPYATEATDPRMHDITEHIYVDGIETDEYQRSIPVNISEELIERLRQTDGLLTFRGSYLRDMTGRELSDVKAGRFSRSMWTYRTGKVLKSNGTDYWSGNGWTGQPLLMRWPKDVRETMNMYDSAKEAEDLVEIIYPGMDGCIHFLDLATGEETRPVIYVGMTFKGTASIYPDGTPLLVCGSGDAQTGQFGENVSQRFYIYSLIDGTLLYEGGYNDDRAPRIWHAYDSSAVIDPVSDTLIQPGENGVIYTLHLNTEYDRESGRLSIAPDEDVRYTFTRDGKYSEGGYLWGSECSAAVYGGYLYIGDNAGTMYCLDINSMRMVWVQEFNEDINSSPILEREDGRTYLYVATTLKYNYNAHSMGEAAIYKLNAINGEVIWKRPYEVQTVKGYAGGVLSTGALGEKSVSDYIFYSISKTPGLEEGYLVAIDKHTGDEVWRVDLDMYSWSSTVITYSEAGGAYLIQGCQNGELLLVDATDGQVFDRLELGSAIEATPAIYGSRLVLATRNERIIGLTLK